MKYGIAEILNLTAEAPTKLAQMEMLRKHDSKTLRTVLVAALDPNVKWNITADEVKFKNNPYLDQESGLYTEIRKLDLFLVGGRGDHLTPQKRSEVFAVFLESIAPADAKLMLAALDKKIPYKIGLDVINTAFPGLINVESPTDFEEFEPEVKPKRTRTKSTEPMRKPVRAPREPMKRVLKGTFPEAVEDNVMDGVMFEVNIPANAIKE